MKTKIVSSVAAIALSLTISGCQAETTDSGLPEEFDFTETEPESEPIQVVSIWAPSAISNALEGVVSEFEQEYGVNVQFSGIELADIQSRLQAGSSPDVFFGSHAWTSDLVQAGTVAKLNTGVLGPAVPDSLKNAFAVEGSTYAVPISEQHVALVCNSELVDEQPDFAVLQEVGLGVGLDPQLGDPYHLYPFMSSFGINLENPEEVDLGTDEGFAFANWLTTTGSEVFDLESDYATVLNDFNSAEIGCWLTGPWALSSISEQLRESLAVYSVPAVGNAEASPLVDVTGFFVSATSDDPVYANRLVLEYFSSPSSQLAVARALTGIPAVQTEDEILSQFASTVENATPTPVSPLMDQLWPLLGSTQAELIRSERSSVEIWAEFLASFESLRGN